MGSGTSDERRIFLWARCGGLGWDGKGGELRMGEIQDLPMPAKFWRDGILLPRLYKPMKKSFYFSCCLQCCA